MLNQYSVMKFSLFFFFLPLVGLNAQSAFKRIGYLPTYRFSFSNQIEYQRLSHLNIAFAHPDSSGNLTTDGTAIGPVVNKAHAAGAKVFISLASSGSWDGLWDYHLDPARLPAFVAKIVQYVQQHQLDGVDIDLEWDYVENTYSPFVIALGTALHAEGKWITAALPGEYRYPEVTDEALATFDWINMMVYDLTGPWAPNNPGPHSPFSWTVNCIDYWLDQEVSPERLTLGVPFYGYNFGVSPVSSITYRSMVAEDTAFAYVDQVGMRYYNGIPTIQAKTQLAMEEVSGIMMWELGQDALSTSLISYSLLRAIDEIAPPIVSANQPDLAHIRLYPNPASDIVWAAGTEHVHIWDINGKLVLETAPESGKINVSRLKSGMYILQARVGEKLLTGRFVKL